MSEISLRIKIHSRSLYGKKSNLYELNENFGGKIHYSAVVASAGGIVPTNPVRNIICLDNTEEVPKTETALLTASSLKKLFGIDNWKCGGLTKSQTPCRRNIPTRFHTRIDELIESMISDHSSSQLQLDLESLVSLVHCHQHRRGYVKEVRLDKWSDLLPSEPDQVAYGTSIERKIELCLGRLSTQCMGTTGVNERCKKSIGGQKIQNCIKTIEKISAADVYLNDTSLDLFLRILATNMRCHLHMRQSCLKDLASWRARIWDVLEKTTPVPDRLKKINTSNKIPRQVLSLPAHETGTKQKDKVSKAGPVMDLPSFPIYVDSTNNLDEYWPEQYDTTPFDIVERSDRPYDYKASYVGVRKQMEKQLSANDQKSGYLYMYEVDGNKGFVKIGLTTRPIDKRHGEWCFDCNRKSRPLFPIPASKAELVPNVPRVEKLCHAELKHRQVVIYCQGCLKTHKEWFELSPTEAIAVVEKWSAWMKREPYHPDRLLLKEEEAHKVSNMDNYMASVLKQGDC